MSPSILEGPWFPILSLMLLLSRWVLLLLLFLNFTTKKYVQILLCLLFFLFFFYSWGLCCTKSSSIYLSDLISHPHQALSSSYTGLLAFPSVFYATQSLHMLFPLPGISLPGLCLVGSYWSFSSTLNPFFLRNAITVSPN